MIASLPMYDRAETAPALDGFWGLIRDNLRAAGIPAPGELDRTTDLWSTWQSPDLVLSQTCGLPFRTKLHGKIQLVGALDFALPDAPAGYYYSQLIVQKDAPGKLADFKDATLAINGYESQSGWAAPQNLAKTLGFSFHKTLISGGHVNSALAVAQGKADIASIDAVTWRLITRYQPEISAQLRMLTHTPATPGLPLITARTIDGETVANAVKSAISDLSAGHRETLGIHRIINIEPQDYLSVPTPPPPPSGTSEN